MTQWLDYLSGLSLRELLEGPEVLFAILGAYVLFEIVRRPPFRRRRHAWRRAWTPRVFRPSATPSPLKPIADPKRQMEVISRVAFEPQPLLNKSEYQVLVLLEAVVREFSAGFRVMAQTSLGEILKPTKGPWNTDDADLAYRAINSKHVDFVVVDRRGMAVLAVEYQGHGHYQGNALMRDAVKREVFRKANVAFFEVPAEFEREDVVAQVRSVLEAQNKAQSAEVVGFRPTPGRAARLKRYPIE
jgi:hypothetical protein